MHTLRHTDTHIESYTYTRATGGLEDGVSNYGQCQHSSKQLPTDLRFNAETLPAYSLPKGKQDSEYICTSMLHSGMIPNGGRNPSVH